ncbi:MAG: hypothetical protein Q4G44_09260 [Alcaligenaceae bacterium]|nr:hypothetical protein [Alcaligenaceae bacterium]
MLSNLSGFSERTPQTYFLSVYALCAIPLFFIRGNIVEHIERTSHSGFYGGLAVWCVALAMILWYYFLPDFSVVQLKKQGKVATAEIIGDSHHAFSGLVPASLDGGKAYSEEHLRKNKAYRHLHVQFENLSGTLITHTFSMPVDYSSSSNLAQVIEEQNQNLQIERGMDQAHMPVWLNSKVKSPAFALANQHGSVSSKHIVLGLCLIIITLLQMSIPLLYVAQTTQHLSDDVFTLFNTPTVWHWAPICNIVILWMFHSHGAVDKAPNGVAADVMKLAGLKGETESITWKATSYGDDVTYYRVYVSYKNSLGHLHELNFKSTVTDSKEKGLEAMPQQRPIFYLESKPDKIYFLDQYHGRFL